MSDKLSAFYRRREYLTTPHPHEVTKAAELRQQLSTLALYPFCPAKPFTGPEGDHERRMLDNQCAALHELVDELAPADLWAMFQVVTLFIKCPVDWQGLVEHQRNFDRLIVEAYTDTPALS